MPRKFAVRWAKVAEQDLEEIVDYVALDSIDEALRILAKLRGEAAALATMPRRGRVVPELQAQGVSVYHELIVSPWRIIYRINEQQVHVLAVFDSRRNLEDILLERLTR
jgi:plasmid stabilization system protein ParE